MASIKSPYKENNININKTLGLGKPTNPTRKVYPYSTYTKKKPIT